MLIKPVDVAGSRVLHERSKVLVDGLVGYDWTAIGRAADGVLVEFGIYFSREEALAAIERG